MRTQVLELLSIHSPINDAPVYFSAVVSSTMDEAAGLADAGAPFGTVIQADYQTGGRGRRSSGAWEAAPGENLLFTVLLKKDSSPSLLLKTPLLIGLAVAQTLERQYSLASVIKWPNDVLADGRKLCGILCRTRRRYLLAGVGINCNQRRFSGPLASRAVSLAHLVGGDVDRPSLLLGVLGALNEIRHLAVWREEIERRLAFRGERRTILPEDDDRDRPVEGVIEGLGRSGELLLRLPGGEVTGIFTGSIH